MKISGKFLSFLLAISLTLSAAACGGPEESSGAGTDVGAGTGTSGEAGTGASRAETGAESGDSAGTGAGGGAETGTGASGTETAAPTPEEVSAVFSQFLLREWGAAADTGIFSYAFQPDGDVTHPETAALSDQLIITHQQDLDLDGQEELAAVILLGSAGSGEGQNRIALSVYEAEDGQAVCRGTAYLDGCYSWNRMEEYILGIRTTDTDVLLYLAADQDGYLFADGVTQQLKVCRYNGKELEFRMDEAISGSDDSWQDGWAEELRSLGFSLASDYDPWKISPDELEPHFWVMCHGEATVNLEDTVAYASACREGTQAQVDYLLNHAEMQGYLNGGDGWVNFGTGWPDVYGEQDSSFVVPDSDSRYLTQEEVAAYSGEKLRLARNEIYARHGRMFEASDLAAYFGHQPWYQPTVPGDEFDDSVLNQWERANVELLLQEEASR